MKAFSSIAMLMLVVLATPLYAEEKPAMDSAMMEKMQKFSTPGEAHKLLESLAGKWNYTSKFQMSADQPAEVTTGSETREVIFGGRFLKQNVTGEWAGQPFEGTGYLGYDNIKEEYVSIWLDSMGTSIMSASGKYDDATKTIGFAGENSCPLTGDKNHKTRGEWVVIDNDHNSYVSYLKDKDGKEFKAMEINYTRA